VRELKTFRIVRTSASPLRFALEIEDDAGGRLQLAATFDDLDFISGLLDEQFEAIVEAAATSADP
jgi:hypothetical protein